MAIQFNGEYNLSTPGNDVGSNLAANSFSFWFQVNMLATAPSYWSLMSKGGGASAGLQAQLVQTGKIDLIFCSPDGNKGYTAAIVPNQPYFCAATWTSGAQAFYINSNTAAATGSLTGNTETNAQYFTFGINGAAPSGMQVIVSQPAVYNYALTATDVLNLLQGTYTPLSSALSGGAANWAWTFDGTLNAHPTANDTGLANFGLAGAGSGNKYVVSSFNPIGGSGSAIYVPDLAYSPATNLTPYVGKSGQTIFFMTTAATTGAISNATLAVTNPTVRVNGSDVSLKGPVYGDQSQQLPYFVYLLPSQVAPTDVLDYTIALGGLVAASGPCGPVSTATAIANYSGSLEPVFGGVTSFTPNPKMPLGINIGGVPFLSYFQYVLAANARLRWSSPFLAYTAGGVCTVDANLQPYTMTANYTFYTFHVDVSQSNGIDGNNYPAPAGIYSFVFDDVNANNPAKALKVWLAGNSNVGTGFDVQNGGPGLNAGSTFYREVAANGTTVTVSYNIEYGSQGSTYGYNLAIIAYFQSPTGNWGANDPVAGTPTITNFWAFLPADSKTTKNNGSPIYPTSPPGPGTYSGPVNLTGNDRSDPYAVSAGLRSWLTAPNGNGPFCIRVVQPVGGGTCVVNYQNPGDLLSPDTWSWEAAAAAPTTTAGGLIQVDYVRFYNTNPALGPSGNNTYGWVSTKVYHPLLGNLGGYGGSDATGNYIDLTLVNAGQGGSVGIGDFGAYLGGGATLEYVCHTPHGFRTGDLLQLPFISGGTPATFPITQGTVTGTLSGTASVLNGSTTVTFSVSQTIASNQGVLFSTDPTGQAYKIGTGGTGTTFTLGTPYEGTTSSSATTTLTACVYVGAAQPPIVVTGEYTLVIACFDTFGLPGHPTYPVQAATTSQIATSNVSCTLDGTCSPTHGSGSVTSSQSLFNQIGRTWQFTGDSSNGTYTVKSGSSTSWTISPTYGGTTASGLTVISTCPPFLCYPLKAPVGTYGFFANMAAQWPNCAIWIPLQPYMSDACLEAVADEIAPFLRVGQTVVAEQGDEHWNTPNFQTGLIDAFYGNLLAYVEPGTMVNEYYAATGSGISNNDYNYTLISAHQHNVLQARLDTYGKGNNVFRLFGSEYAGANTTANICNFAVTLGTVGGTNPRGLQQQIPISGCAIAPYINAPTSIAGVLDATFTTACSSAGGAWPVIAIHDAYRHYLKYGTNAYTFYAQHSGQMQTDYVVDGTPGPAAFGQVNGLPAMVAYEAQIQQVDPNNNTALEHDIFYHPAMADTFNTFLQSMQDGDPYQAGTNFSWAVLFHLGGGWGGAAEQALWSTIIYQGQAWGSGSSNQFTTPQGGSPGNGKCFDITNESVEMKQVLSWYATANPTLTTPMAPSLRQWFAGLRRRIG